MDTGKLTTWVDQVQPILLAFGLKVLGAIAVFVAVSYTHLTLPTSDLV